MTQLLLLISLLLASGITEKIIFTPLTLPQLFSSSIGYFIDECSFISYQPHDNNNTYHWYTQSITNFTNTNVYNDLIQEFNISSNNLTNQIPHIVWYDPSGSLSLCSSPKTGDILSCYTDMSCCGACNYGNCNLFINNGSEPYWQLNNTMITAMFIHEYFNENINVECMNDGYLISWVNAKRNQEIYTEFSIKYSTMDMNGNVVILNKYLYNFTNLYIKQGSDTFSVSMSDDQDSIIMSYMEMNGTKGEYYINYLISKYNGINNGLEIQQIANLIDIDAAINKAIPTNSSVYNTIKTVVSEQNNCCFISLFKAPMNGKINLMLNAVNDIGVNVLQSEKYIEVMSIDVDEIYDAQLIEMNISDDDDIRYEFVMVSYQKTLIGYVYEFKYDKNKQQWSIEALNHFEFVNDNNDDSFDYWYAFCMNMLQGSKALLISWIQNSYNLLNGDIVKGYAQSWNVTIQQN